MSQPEVIKTILQRVLRDLEQKYEDEIGGRPSGLKWKAQTLPARILSGGKIGRLDQTLPTTDNEWLAEKS